MADDGQVAEQVARRFEEMRPYLDEQQRRRRLLLLLLGAEARALGRGGIKAVAAATGAHPDTVARACGSWTPGPSPTAGSASPARAARS